MPQDNPYTADRPRSEQSSGASALAQSAVTILSKRQTTTALGARQFILDYLLRAVLSRTGFDGAQMLEEMRGLRLSLDTIIDVYVPLTARRLGEMWKDDDLDFASVTVGSMRLQALLSFAAVEAVDVVRQSDDAPLMLIVVPMGEQHTLGAFVLAAQLRRLGARTDMSFCETPEDAVSRLICEPPSAVLFTVSSQSSLESVSRLVLDIRAISNAKPALILGGSLCVPEDEAREVSGVDIVTSQARDALSHTLAHMKSKSVHKLR